MINRENELRAANSDLRTEIDELRSTLKQTRQELADEVALKGMITSAINNDQLSQYIEKHGNPPQIVAERDKFETEATGLRAELATQTELVEKCMVAMNENADKGEKAEAELAMLKAQPVQEPIERTAWLIEFSQNQQPVWVKSIWLDDGFTNDANEAILFPTKRCAEDVLDRLFSTPRNKTVFRAARKVYRVTEHIFYAAPVQPALTGEQTCKMCGYIGCDTDACGECPRCHWDELVPTEVSSLLSALNAMLTQFGMDEDEWNKPTFDQARAAVRTGGAG